MKKINNFLFFAFFILLILVVFKSWFGFGLITGGDFQVYFKSMFLGLSDFPPPAWNYILGTALGVNGTSVLWNYFVVEIPIIFFGRILGFKWEIVERLGYLFPYLILSLIIPYYVFRKFLATSWAFISVLLFSFNTYILMLIGGGQIFLSLAYVLAPLVFYLFYKLINEKNNFKDRLKVLCLCVFATSFQILFDIRIAYVTLFMISIFYLFNFLFFGKRFKGLLYLPCVLISAGFLHAFWILPTLFVRQNPLSTFGSEFTSTGIVQFLSFAKFENTISLLQSNWPENIFGKVYFMRPEFLILPILAFSSLFFLKNEKKQTREIILFFSFLALIGAFLAKGTNEPFGEMYAWMFKYVPGFVMFRDPSKWYPLVAISYAFLIPYTIMKVSSIRYSVFRKYSIQNTQYSILIAFILFFLLLIRPAWMGQLNGTFKITKIPQEYIKLEQFFERDKSFFRTFWVPYSSTFSSFSPIHPLVLGSSFVGRQGKASSVVSYLKQKGSDKILQDISVKYIVVPHDADAKIFLTDRKYDEKKYLKTVDEVKKLNYVKEVAGFGKIKVFETSSYKDHFSSPSRNLGIQYKFINPTKYEITVNNAKKGDVLVFAENFDSYWIARNKSIEYSVSSIQYPVTKVTSLNSFVLPKDGDYSFEVYYRVQDLVNFGLMISGASLLVVLLLLYRTR